MVTVTVERHEVAAGGDVVRLAGELDLAGAHGLRAALLDCGPDVVVDLSDLAFVDAYGMSAFVSARSALEAGGGHLELRGPTRWVASVLALGGLSSLLA